MKSVFYILLGFCSIYSTKIAAASISREVAAQRAASYLCKVTTSHQLKLVTESAHIASKGRKTPDEVAYYVFSRGSGQGFVIASADDCIVPVLGYTDNGDFDYNKLPPNMQDWLDYLEKQIEYVRQQPSIGLKAYLSAHPMIPTLLTCNWDQGYPYNDDCPVDFNGNHCLTGCVATAMAQIMYYHREKSVKAILKDMPAYHTDELYVAGIPQGASIDWDNMIDEYSMTINNDSEFGGYEMIDHFTDVQKKAVARLMHYCGVSVFMKYSTYASYAMTADVANAFKKYFGYYENIRFVSRSSCSAEQWDAIIYNDISQGYPVYLSGYNPKGGHAFVCDGFDGNGCYHINWGWGGYCNGYFLLNKLTPYSQDAGGTFDGYNDSQEAIVGIVPAFIMPIPFKNKIVKNLCIQNWDKDEDKELSYDEAAAITDLGIVFSGTNITSFDEMQYFTGLSTIADNAFNNCSRLSKITIPENVGRIGINAFNGCRALKSIDFPDSIVSIGDMAFKDCDLITMIELPEKIYEVGNRAFEGCTKLFSLTLKSLDPSTIVLGDSVFAGIDLNSVTLFVLEGTKTFYELAPQWNSFGIIKEIRKEGSKEYDAAKELRKLLDKAQSKKVNSEREQIVYDNILSTEAELLQAQRTLRKKLGFITFSDKKVKNIIQSLWDKDLDGELTKTELSDVNQYEITGTFRNSDITFFEEFEFFTGLSYLPDSCFCGCKKLQTIKIPKNVGRIGNDAFNGCSSLNRVVLPSLTKIIYDGCFKGCTGLVEFYTFSPVPPNSLSKLQLRNAFGELDYSKAILYVPRGTKEQYRKDNMWNKFGEIKEMHTANLPTPIPLTIDENVFVYNVGNGLFINKGEAWGTQAVGASEGLVYRVRHSKNMPEGVYRLASTGGNLFRTNQDPKVGLGVNACFIDGQSNQNSYWHIIAQKDGTYKIQVPEESVDYVEDEYLGICDYSQSEYVFDSKGLYYDCIDDWNDVARQTEWAFIRVEDYEKQKELEDLLNKLGNFIRIAKEKEIDVISEELVYEKNESSNEEIKEAIQSIRKKMHYIEFLDINTKKAFIDRWDQDEDDELSIEEAEAVISIGQTFRNNRVLKELDELKYFTSIKEIEPNAFSGATSLQSIYIPSNVTQIGESAFAGCNKLRYAAILNEKRVITDDLSELSNNVVIFVPLNMLSEYQKDECWLQKGNEIFEYTGFPIVTAVGSHEYGTFSKNVRVKVKGAPIVGDAEISFGENILSTTPVGDYPLFLSSGSIITSDVTFKDGVFTVTPAPLTISANSYTRTKGFPNPTFEVSYTGFRNLETEDVLIKKPITTCDAAINSPIGEYEIMVTDAEAENYEISYLPGVLTIVDTDAINNIMSDELQDKTLYDLYGRKVLNSKFATGVFILNRNKIVIK